MYDAVPSELKVRPQWVTWRFEVDPERPDKPKKMPYNPHNGRRAQSNNAQTWAGFDVALKAAQARGHEGVGFVFSPDDPFVGIDLDDCIDDDGRMAEWAQSIIDTMQSYSEISPSGRGVKLIVEGEMPADVPSVKTEHVEIYTQGRYFTITGRHLTGTPTTVRNVNGAVADLCRQVRPAPETPTPARCAAPAAPEYLRVWAERIVDQAASRVALASDGNLHNTRLDMARWVGGLLPLGLADADTLAHRLYQARIPKAHHAQEMKAIYDGLRLGADKPLEAPEPPPQPLFDSAGVAYCPTHRVVLPRAKNGNGHKCHQPDPSTATGWCDFWWKGEGYVTPSPQSVAAAPKNGDAGSGGNGEPDMTTADGNAIADRAVGTAMPPHVAPAPAAQVARFALYSINALRDLPPVTWLIDGEIPARLMTVVCGPSGAGKSMLMVDYVLRTARRFPDRTVIYVAAEGGGGYHARVDAWLAKFGGATPSNVLFVVREVALLDPLAVASFIAAVREHNPILVAFDTLARCMVGGDENSAKDMGLFVRGCDTVRMELDAAVAVVHHAGKSGAGYRGSSALYAAADSWVDVANDDGLITVSCAKAKDWRPFDPRYLRMVTVGDSMVLVPSDQVSQRGAPLTEGQRKVLETLALDIFQDPGAKRAELVAATSIPDVTMYRILSRLKRDGMIQQSKKGDPYFISPLGLQTIRNYHRDLRQHNAELSQLSDNYSQLSNQPSPTITTITPLYRGDSDSESDSESGELPPPGGIPTDVWQSVVDAYSVGNWAKVRKAAQEHGVTYTDMLASIRASVGGEA